jgi:AcrR family transcriptional regulator
MARPRSITDERLLGAASIVIGRDGPEFTLAEVAAQADVAVGTVAKRFGGKAGLLHALTTWSSARTVARMRSAATEAGGGVAGVRAALLSWFELEPATATNHLAQLGVDLIDPELRSQLARLLSDVDGQLRKLLAAADLPGAPSNRIAARVLVGLVNGAALNWSVRPNGHLRERIAGDLDAVLDGWKE